MMSNKFQHCALLISKFAVHRIHQVRLPQALNQLWMDALPEIGDNLSSRFQQDSNCCELITTVYSHYATVAPKNAINDIL